MSETTAVGIDIGGTGIKASIVDTAAGELTIPRVRVPTPDPASPEAMIDVIAELVREATDLAEIEPSVIGAGFPGVIRDGVIKTSANLDDAWIGVDGVEELSARLGTPTHLINDADAAGVAEMRFGAGVGQRGVVLMVTLGTGIGSGLFHDGSLVPNTELGHLELGGEIAEKRAASSIRKKHDLSWKAWGQEVDTYLLEIEKLFWPDLIIIGGGVSKRFAKFSGHLTGATPVVPAALGNTAGIIGAAVWAAERT